jgi:cytochrome c556
VLGLRRAWNSRPDLVFVGIDRSVKVAIAQDPTRQPLQRGDVPMIRISLAITTMLFGLGIALAQQDPIAARKALMKANGDQAKIGVAMIKGDQPFDAAAVHKIFATFEDAAAKMPNLFPDNSKTGGDTSADPKVWENMPDFKARFSKFGNDAKAADASSKDIDSFKTAFADIGKNDCGSCHQLYRVKKN